MYNKIEIINELLSNHQELICDLAYKRDINYIKEVLKMKEWEDPKFQGLLTSTMWQSNIETIRKILNSKILGDDKYKHLLVPSIFNVSLKNVYKMIELLKEYEIDKYITNRCIRRDYKMQKVLLDYLVENNIELIIENKYQKMVLNPIINASTSDLKKKYGIDIKKCLRRLDVVVENNINIDLSKYSNDAIKNIEIDNVTKILDYLYKIKCPIIDDIVEDYFDIFTIKYNEFIKKVEYLNNKYNDLYFNLAEKDLNYLEELFIDN